MLNELWDDSTADISTIRCPAKKNVEDFARCLHVSYELQESRENCLATSDQRLQLQKAAVGTPHGQKCIEWKANF